MGEEEEEEDLCCDEEERIVLPRSEHKSERTERAQRERERRRREKEERERETDLSLSLLLFSPQIESRDREWVSRNRAEELAGWIGG